MATPVIHKFPLELRPGPQFIQHPANWAPLHAGLDAAGNPAVWLAVDQNELTPNDTENQSRFYVVATGEPLPEAGHPSLTARHHGTFVTGNLVLHVISTASDAEVRLAVEREEAFEKMMDQMGGASLQQMIEGHAEAVPAEQRDTNDA